MVSACTFLFFLKYNTTLHNHAAPPAITDYGLELDEYLRGLLLWLRLITILRLWARVERDYASWRRAAWPPSGRPAAPRAAPQRLDLVVFELLALVVVLVAVADVAIPGALLPMRPHLLLLLAAAATGAEGLPKARAEGEDQSSAHAAEHACRRPLLHRRDIRRQRKSEERVRLGGLLAGGWRRAPEAPAPSSAE